MAKKYSGSVETADIETNGTKAKEKTDATVHKKRHVKLIIAAAVAFVICAACSTLYVVRANDVGYGSKDPEELAVSYMTDVASHSDDIWQYIPREVRDMNMTSVNSVWMAVDESAGMNVKFDNVKATASESMKDKLDDFKKGYKALYGKDIDIKDAVRVDLTSDLSYNTPKLGYAAKIKDYSKTVSFSVPCVQVGSKWYVYTGGDIDGLKTFPDDVFHIDEEDYEPDSTADYEGKPEDIPDYHPEVPSIDKYAGVTDDLRAGYVTVDGYQFTMPVDYSALSDVLKIRDKAIKDSDRMIASGKVFKNLPAFYVNPDYTEIVPGINIANPYDEAKDLTEGVVTSLYMYKPANTKAKYPSVVLPGNVTFGTTFEDTANVYGTGVLTKYNGKNEYINNLGYQDTCSIYTVNLNNDLNHLYMIYAHVDAKDPRSASEQVLVAVCWQYADINDLIERNG